MQVLLSSFLPVTCSFVAGLLLAGIPAGIIFTDVDGAFNHPGAMLDQWCAPVQMFTNFHVNVKHFRADYQRYFSYLHRFRQALMLSFIREFCPAADLAGMVHRCCVNWH